MLCLDIPFFPKWCGTVWISLAFVGTLFLTGCQSFSNSGGSAVARGAAPGLRKVVALAPGEQLVQSAADRVEPDDEFDVERELDELISDGKTPDVIQPPGGGPVHQSLAGSTEGSLSPPKIAGRERTPFLVEEPEAEQVVQPWNEPESFSPGPPLARRWGDRELEPPEEQSFDFSSVELGEDCEPFRLGDDLKAFPCMFWEDAKSLVTWQNALILGAAGGAAVYVRNNFDQQVRYETAEHPLRWGQGSVVLRQFGEYSYQVPVLVGVYAVGLWTQDPTLHEFSLSTISAYGLSSIITVSIKGIANSTRPTTQFENGHYGFPSFHASSTFTIAANLDEFYGWQVGVPAYVLAGLVSWSRIDQREHDLSDVLFGAVLGIVVGKTVAAAHLDRQADLKIAPYYDYQNNAAGVSVEKKF